MICDFFQSARHRPKLAFIVLLPFTLHVAAPRAQESINPETAESYLAVLRDLEGQVIDVNKAGMQDLQTLPWLSPEVARGVITYRRRFGPFRNLNDLGKVPGVTADVLAAIRPYLSVSSRRGPRVRTRLRITRPSNHPTAWPNLRLYQRSEVATRHAEGVFLTERDPLEGRLTDFLSGYLRVSAVPGLQRVLVGDFRPGYGQGLLFSRHNRSATGLERARPMNVRRVGYRSAIEDGALRGVFAESRSGRITWTAMFARNRWDAAIDSAGVAAIRTADLHVTRTQRERRGKLRENLAALRSHVDLPVGMDRGHPRPNHILAAASARPTPAFSRYGLGSAFEPSERLRRIRGFRQKRRRLAGRRAGRVRSPHPGDACPPVPGRIFEPARRPFLRVQRRKRVGSFHRRHLAARPANPGSGHPGPPRPPRASGQTEATRAGRTILPQFETTPEIRHHTARAGHAAADGYDIGILGRQTPETRPTPYHDSAVRGAPQPLAGKHRRPLPGPQERRQRRGYRPPASAKDAPAGRRLDGSIQRHALRFPHLYVRARRVGRQSPATPLRQRPYGRLPVHFNRIAHPCFRAIRDKNHSGRSVEHLGIAD